MLRHLHIQNYALIDSLDIDFDRGFSVITGETGAGKSILLGAIGLLLGQRAEAKSIKAGESRCVIEAEFGVSDANLSEFFTANDLDFDGSSCIIRRELTSAGKSRAFINDTPATVAQLRELGDALIDIHSQHQNLLLGKGDFQLSVLDIVAQNGDLLTEYQRTYKTYKETEKKLREAQEALQKEQSEQDYMQFQFRQLDDAKLQQGEQEELEAEQRTLEHAEEIKGTLFQASDILQGEELGIVGNIRNVLRQLEGIASVYPKAEELTRRIDSCYIELKDIAAEMDHSMESVEDNPKRLEQVNDRLSLIYELQGKHHADTVEELIKLHSDLKLRLALMGNRDEQIRELQSKLNITSNELRAKADTLTSARRRAASVLEQGMCEKLMPLGMPNIQFRADITPLPEPGAWGADNVQFSFSANKNSPLQPISQVASGGEIARVMLSLKATISNATHLPTIIFDEIDTGVSGHIAESMARLMRGMCQGGQRQVISITHLPQIAARGEHHFRVYKEEDKQGAASHIVSLGEKERIEEIAHMLSGSTVSQAAIDNAKELLSHIS